MDITTLVRSVTVFVILLVTMGINGTDNLIARLGMGGNYALVLGLAVLFTLFLVGRNIYVIGVVAVLSLIANMPADFTLNFGFDRDYYAGVMVALLFQPVVTRLMA
jgi:hypothetical protein